MCLRVVFKGEVPRKEAKEPLVAEKDIKVYKRLETHDYAKDVYFSPFKYMRYEPGFMYYQTGRHFSIKYKCTTFMGKTRTEVYINQGLHSYKSLKKAVNMYYNAYIYAELIIPKGAKYFVYGNEYCSNKLIFHKDAKIFNSQGKLIDYQ